MLGESEFLSWCHRVNLSDKAEQLIHHIRTSPPSRLVKSGRSNVSGRYPSRKMGVTIQFESHKLELARIYELEHDAEVLEYYDQPASIKLNYEAKNGRRLGVIHTPDFFVIRTNSAGWEECKMEDHLAELAQKNPNRYCWDEDSAWCCPPGEGYARQFGLYYRLRSSAETNWAFYRNIEFLDNYLRIDTPVVSAKARSTILEQVIAEPGITLKALVERTSGAATRDDIHMLIAHEEIYVNLSETALADAEYVRVFANREVATAFTQLRVAAPHAAYAPPPVNFAPGSLLEWDGRGWEVVNVGERLIGLLDENKNFSEIPLATLEKLVDEGRITGVAFGKVEEANPEAQERVGRASRKDFAEANHRAEIVRARLQGAELPEQDAPNVRTVRRWVARYLAAEVAYGAGYIGLLPQHRKGNPTPKLPPDAVALMKEFIENDYETLKQKSKKTVYGAYLLECDRRGILPASYKAFYRAVKCRPRYEQTLKRQGRRAAYKYEDFYWKLDQTTPPHGEHPFHIAHIDHTQADDELVDSLTGANLGRPWATFLTDACTRRQLAVYLTFDSPSYRSCMMALRECVRRFGRIPQIVVTDGALEFGGIYLETLLARYDCTKKKRPPAKGRFGSLIERLFNTTNTQFFHNLAGNTQIMRNVRQVTKSVNPKGQAVWMLGRLYSRLCEYSYEVYDKLKHSTLGVSPREAFAAGMASGGERLFKRIPYNEEFRIFTLPTTRKGWATVQPNYTIKVNHINYRLGAIRYPDLLGAHLPVRFDPWDMGRAFAFLKGQWTLCISEYYRVYHNRSEREVQLASEELRQRRRNNTKSFHGNARDLALFLESAEAEEALLKQRMADREARGIWEVIDGGSGQLALPPAADATASDEADHQEDAATEPIHSFPDISRLQVYGEF